MQGRTRVNIMEKPLISIVVAAYNSDLTKLKKTLTSAIRQEGISFEIIVTDDGSKQNYFEELKAFFASNNFKDYQLLGHEKNGGTVANVYDGVCHANGKYSKLISGGDYLYSKTCLKEMSDYMEKHGIKACFSNAAYYEPSEQLKLVNLKSSPALKGMFTAENYDPKKCYLDYLGMQDGALGATFLTETEMLKTYFAKALGKLILFEDYTYAYMMFMGEKVYYYPEITVWYEYGTGVSTSDGERKMKLCLREFDGLKQMILETPKRQDLKAYEKKYLKMLMNMPFKTKGQSLIYRYLNIPALIGLKLKHMFAAETTPTLGQVNAEFFDEINREVTDGN